MYQKYSEFFILQTFQNVQTTFYSSDNFNTGMLSIDAFVRQNCKTNSWIALKNVMYSN